jgi:hypothetical protein
MAIDPRALGRPPTKRMVFALDEKMMNLRRGVAGEVGNDVECRSLQVCILIGRKRLTHGDLTLFRPLKRA